MSVLGAERLIKRQHDPRVRGILIHRLFGDHPGAPFDSSQCQSLLQQFTEDADPDLAQYAAALLLGYWPWFTRNMWRPSRKANRSVSLLVKGLGLRKRAPKRKGVLEMYFQDQLKIGMRINWRKALGKDLRPIEERCLRLQRWMIGDPSARIMSLDTFNESLIQAFSTKHPTLKVEYKNCIRPGNAVPDYGQWLQYKGALGNVLPNSTKWLTDVHRLRVKADLAHAKDRKSGAHTRPVSFDKADALFKRAQAAWAELIREWMKIL